MKTMKLFQLAVAMTFAFGTVACSKIPAAYRGTFEDRSQGASLTLKSSKAELKLADGRTLQAKAEDLSFDAIAQGNAGIFVRQNPENADLVEVFWVNPNVASKQAVEGFVWLESELIYGLMDSKKDAQVPNLQLLHCTNGTVMLDVNAKSFQMGCPAGSPTLDMIRVGT